MDAILWEETAKGGFFGAASITLYEYIDPNLPNFPAGQITVSEKIATTLLVDSGFGQNFHSFMPSFPAVPLEDNISADRIQEILNKKIDYSKTILSPFSPLVILRFSKSFAEFKEIFNEKFRIANITKANSEFSLPIFSRESFLAEIKNESLSMSVGGFGEIKRILSRTNKVIYPRSAVSSPGRIGRLA